MPATMTSDPTTAAAKASLASSMLVRRSHVLVKGSYRQTSCKVREMDKKVLKRKREGVEEKLQLKKSQVEERAKKALHLQSRTLRV